MLLAICNQSGLQYSPRIFAACVAYCRLAFAAIGNALLSHILSPIHLPLLHFLYPY